MMTRMVKILAPVGVLLVAAAVTALLVRTRPRVQPEPREPARPVVRTVEVRPEAYRHRVRAQGTVMPRAEVQMAAEVTGRIVAVSPAFTPGGFFRAGEVLVEVDPRDYGLAVTRARAAQAEATVALQRETAEAALARSEWDALGPGRDANPLLLREPQLAEARARLDAAGANLRQAELDLERCRLRAPFDGRVRTQEVDAGQYVVRGQAVGRAYATDAAEVRLALPLDDLAFVDLPMGRDADPGPEGGPGVVLRARLGRIDAEWRGRIVRTEGEIDPRTRMLTAVARVDDPYRDSGPGRPPLAVGLFVGAEIEGIPAGEVYRIPRAALRGEDRVLVVDSDGTLRFRRVEVVRRDAGEVIVAAGLRPAERVCISPLDAPVDGMQVRRADDEVSGASAPAPAGGSRP